VARADGPGRDHQAARALLDIGTVTTTNKVWLNCRDDDYCMFRFADPEFTRGYISNIVQLPLNKVAGIFTGANYPWTARSR
jgi:hypothetical protein